MRSIIVKHVAGPSFTSQSYTCHLRHLHSSTNTRRDQAAQYPATVAAKQKSLSISPRSKRDPSHLDLGGRREALALFIDKKTKLSILHFHVLPQIS